MIVENNLDYVRRVHIRFCYRMKEFRCPENAADDRFDT